MRINNYQKYRNSIFAIVSILIFLVFCMAIFTGCDGSGDPGSRNARMDAGEKGDAGIETTAARTDGPEVTGTAMQKNILIAAIDTTYPPFGFLEDGEVIGFDIDIINEIAVRLDKEIAIEQFHWDPEFEGLQEGEYDLVISAVPYSEEKEKDVDFSTPYFSMKYVLISLLGSEVTMKEELEGKDIGILNSGTDDIDEEYLSKFEINEYEDAIGLLEALKDKEVEAMLISLPIAANLLKGNKDIYTVIEEVPANKDFVIVFAKDNGLKPEFDAALEAMKADGTYDGIYSKWFDYSSEISIEE